MVEYVEKDVGRAPRKKPVDKRKVIKILNLFILYYTQYLKERGQHDVYIPTTREVHLCEILSGLPYTIYQWERFIQTYFDNLNELLERGSRPSFTHFVDNFNKISHLCEV